MRCISSNHFKNPTLIYHQLDNYSDFELSSIYVDMVQLKQEIFHQNAQCNRSYLATAGVSGCGKTVLLENILESKENRGRIYIDSHHILLRMELTYEADVRLGRKTIGEAREYWQEASNFISDLFLAIAFQRGYAIAHGTSMIGRDSCKNLKKIRSNYHYEITLLHLTCAEPTLNASQRVRKNRDQIYCSSSELKAELSCFHNRLPDYLKTAQKVDFYYRSDMSRAQKVAVLMQKELNVLHPMNYHFVQKSHDEVKSQGAWCSCFNDCKIAVL